MNERIEALKKLATKEVWGNNPYNGSPEFDGYELDADMFAELVVAECVIQCEREWIRHGTDSIHNQAIHGCINSIKKHFGVKE